MSYKKVEVDLTTVANTDLYTIPANRVGAIIVGVENVSGVDRTYTLKHYHAATLSTTTFVNAATISGTQRAPDPSWLVVAEGDIIRGSASANSSVTVTINLNEQVVDTNEGLGDLIGATGSTGPVGATGAGTTGATGSAGAAGGQGATGATGPAGSGGAAGSAGATGATGPAGSGGAAGAAGATGATGPTGATGSGGAGGTTGATGAVGATGASSNLGVLSAAITVPVSSDFAWKGGTQGGATITDHALGFTMANPAVSGTNLRLFGRAIPGGATWSATLGFRLTPAITTGSGDWNAGLYVRDSTAGTPKLVALQLQQSPSGTPVMSLISGKYTSVSAFSASYIAQAFNDYVVWMRVSADATNYTWSISLDGTNFSIVGVAKGKTDFLAAAADEVGVFMNCPLSTGTGGTAYMDIFEYAQG
jgi:hypothetical protein